VARCASIALAARRRASLGGPSGAPTLSWRPARGHG